MTEPKEVAKWVLLHGELVREDDGPLVWAADYDALAAKLAKAEWLLNDALVQLREGKIRTRRNRADLIDKFLDELKGNTDEKR